MNDPIFVYILQGAWKRLSTLRLPASARIFALCYDSDAPLAYAEKTVFDPRCTRAEGLNQMISLARARVPDADYFIICEDDVAFTHGSFELFEAKIAATRPIVGVPVVPKAVLHHTILDGVPVQRGIVLDEQLFAMHRSVLDTPGLGIQETRYEDLSRFVSCLIFKYTILKFHGSYCHQYNEIEIENPVHTVHDGTTLYKLGSEAEFFPVFISHIIKQHGSYDTSVFEPFVGPRPPIARAAVQRAAHLSQARQWTSLTGAVGAPARVPPRRSHAPPRVSVLMPVHDEERYCAQAIESILDQTYSAFEFIIVNDGSTDGSATILNRYARQDSRIRIIHQAANKGISASLNAGLSAARGDLIARMDADDVAFPHRLATQLRFMDHQPDIAAVGSSYCHIGADGTDLAQISHRPGNIANLSDALLEENVFAHPTMMMRRAPILEIGGYRPAFDLVEDYDLWLRLSERAAMANIPDAWGLPDILMCRRLHAGNVHEYAGDRQEFMTRVARLAAQRRRRGEPDPFNNTDRYDDSSMLDLLGLPPAEKARFWIEFVSRKAGWVVRQVKPLESDSPASTRHDA